MTCGHEAKWPECLTGAALIGGLAFGSITLESKTAWLTNGSFLTLAGDISITSSVLTNANHLLQTGRKLTLNVTDV